VTGAAKFRRVARWMTTAVAAVVAPVAMACGFDGLLGDQFSAQHAKSLPVAFAISDAVAAGAIGKGALAPIEPGQKGYWRAMTRLQELAQTLSGDADKRATPPNVAVLLIDSRLWTRLRGGPSGYEIEAHAPGPAPEDVVIVTNEFVLAALLDGSLAAPRALNIGVLAIDGEAARVAAVRNNLSARLVAGAAVTSEQRGARKFLSPWGSARSSAR